MLAVVLIAGAAFAASLLFSSPKGAVGTAAAATWQEYKDACSGIIKTDFQALQESKKISCTIDAELTEMPYEAEILEGLGFTVKTDTNLPDRKMAVSAGVRFGALTVASVDVFADDSLVAVGSPELTNGEFYGLHTDAFTDELKHLDEYDELPNIAFNLFDIMETMSVKTELNPEATKAFLEAIEVEKIGSDDIKVNGQSVKCKEYTVLVPEDAMIDYLDACRDAVDDLELDRTLEDLLEGTGLEELGIEANLSSGMDELFDNLEMVLEELGDVELQVYLNSGHLAAVIIEHDVDGGVIELTANFGGKKNYADAFSLELIANDGHDDIFELMLTSEGNHSMDGEFTDETTIEIGSYGDLMEFSSELRYDAGAKSDNFEWILDLSEVELVLAGQLDSEKDTFRFAFDELSLTTEGETLALNGTYALEPCKKLSLNTKDVTMLEDLDLDDLYDVVMDIADNLEDMMYDLMESIPELEDLM